MATVQQVKQHLAGFAFKKLFIEVLGWDKPTQNLAVDVHGRRYDLIDLASKVGRGIYLCTREVIPSKAERIAIDHELTKLRARHLLIFTNSAKTEQIWLYTPRVRGEDRVIRTRYVEHPFNPGEQGERGQTGEPLAQLLLKLEVTFAEEDALTGPDVDARLEALNVERVTKRFYTAFQAKHTQLAAQVSGMDDAGPEQREWYASLILNRLMFSYFIQKKGFLDGNQEYLRHHLATRADTDGSTTFYRTFLLKFFHAGLGGRSEERSPAVHALIGNVPYLNGGLFEEHQIERDHRDTLDIPDAAFAMIFDFFEGYQWHLDTTGMHQDNEINPDVLGYIFEKYINQKQMGAYYTKEDITEYISKNTIIPFLFDRACEGCQTAFDANGPVWSLLRNDPDRYIYEAVRRGATVALPPEIAVGIADVSQRTLWNKAAPARKDDTDFALPTETWRELVARRQRYEEIKGKLSAGEVTQINDLITYNLDSILFARDVIQSYEGVDLIKAFYKAIIAITVLDPTCGSGAFLFAALNILEPLYEACLDAMQNFVLADDARLEAEGGRQHYEKTFRLWLEEASGHKNRRYFIYKSIIIRNLFGVDIMEEAVEIAKLRLFLKLVAQTDDITTLEPLPDIDFNIRAGNTLVGYARRDDIAAAVGLDMEGVMARIDEKAEELGRSLDSFRQQQTVLGGKVTQEDKQQLHMRMAKLNDELDRYLAGQYGVEPNDAATFTLWRESHKPFHWYAQFFGIMHEKSATEQRGFDVIIGNPPYVEYYADKFNYKLKNYETLSCANLYTCVVERCKTLINQTGKHSMILPLSAFATRNMTPFIELFQSWFPLTWISFYHFRPSMLFSGGTVASIPTAIYVGSLNKGNSIHYTTGVTKWSTDARDSLFRMVSYAVIDIPKDKSNRHYYAKFLSPIENPIMRNILQHSEVQLCVSKSPSSEKMCYRSAGGLYWKIFIDKDWPYVTTSNKTCYFKSEYEALVFVALFNSSLFWWYYTVTFDTFNLKDYMLFSFRFKYPNKDIADKLARLADKLTISFESNAKHLVRGNTGSYTVYAKKSKPIIDEIDRVLAEHYGFTAEELDFIINYDIKYRMGREAESEE